MVKTESDDPRLKRSCSCRYLHIERKERGNTTHVFSVSLKNFYFQCSTGRDRIWEMIELSELDFKIPGHLDQ